MKVLAGIVATLTALIMWHILGGKLLRWVFTRVPPTTPPDWQPRYRRWHAGMEVHDGQGAWQ